MIPAWELVGRQFVGTLCDTRRIEPLVCVALTVFDARPSHKDNRDYRSDRLRRGRVGAVERASYERDLGSVG